MSAARFMDDAGAMPLYNANGVLTIPPLSAEEKQATIKAMERLGGSFVKALAEAWLRADPENNRRIIAAWPEYIEKYRAIAKARGQS